MTSNNSPEIIRMQGVHLLLPGPLYSPQSLRDEFISFLKGPLGKITAKKKVVHALNNISVSISKGERVGIVGVNGSGKTSLCRCLSQMLIPTRGQIKIQGEVRCVFDSNIGLNFELTGRENAQLLALFLYPHIKDHRELVEECLEFSELGEFVDIPLKNYSKGMKVRLFLSLISAIPADILILDEVFDGADTFFQKKVSHRILKLIDNSNAAVLVGHDMEHMQRVCDRILVMEQGKIIFDGPSSNAVEYYLAQSPTQPPQLSNT